MAGILQGIQSAASSVGQAISGSSDPNAEITRLEGEVTAAKTKVAELEQKLKEARDKAAAAGMAVSEATGGRKSRRKGSKRRHTQKGRGSKYASALPLVVSAPRPTPPKKGSK